MVDAQCEKQLLSSLPPSEDSELALTRQECWLERRQVREGCVEARYGLGFVTHGAIAHTQIKVGLCQERGLGPWTGTGRLSITCCKCRIPGVGVPPFR